MAYCSNKKATQPVFCEPLGGETQVCSMIACSPPRPRGLTHPHIVRGLIDECTAMLADGTLKPTPTQVRRGRQAGRQFPTELGWKCNVLAVHEFFVQIT